MFGIGWVNIGTRTKIPSSGSRLEQVSRPQDYDLLYFTIVLLASVAHFELRHALWIAPAQRVLHIKELLSVNPTDVPWKHWTIMDVSLTLLSRCYANRAVIARPHPQVFPVKSRIAKHQAFVILTARINSILYIMPPTFVVRKYEAGAKIVFPMNAIFNCRALVILWENIWENLTDRSRSHR